MKVVGKNGETCGNEKTKPNAAANKNLCPTSTDSYISSFSGG